ncbi:hypothetical protein ACFPRL_00020 [Pseudoclavibacter helvolus]
MERPELRGWVDRVRSPSARSRRLPDEPFEDDPRAGLRFSEPRGCCWSAHGLEVPGADHVRRRDRRNPREDHALP